MLWYNTVCENSIMSGLVWRPFYVVRVLSVKQNPNKQTQKPNQACKQEFNLTESVAALAFPYFSPEQSQCILMKQQSPVMHKWAIPKCLTVRFVMENRYAVIFGLVVLVLFSLIHQTTVTFVFIVCCHEIWSPDWPELSGFSSIILWSVFCRSNPNLGFSKSGKHIGNMRSFLHVLTNWAYTHSHKFMQLLCY